MKTVVRRQAARLGLPLLDLLEIRAHLRVFFCKKTAKRRPPSADTAGSTEPAFFLENSECSIFSDIQKVEISFGMQEHLETSPHQVSQKYFLRERARE
jgi:hypothetical protein